MKDVRRIALSSALSLACLCDIVFCNKIIIWPNRIMRYSQKRAILILVVILCAVIAASLLGLHYYNKTPHISFSHWVAVKPIEAEDNRSRCAVESMISAEETWVSYKELVNYVAGHVGGETSMILRP